MSGHRRFTYAELAGEATKKYGPNPTKWAFKCPRCGDVATAADFPEGDTDQVGRRCRGFITRFRQAYLAPRAGGAAALLGRRRQPPKRSPMSDCDSR